MRSLRRIVTRAGGRESGEWSVARAEGAVVLVGPGGDADEQHWAAVALAAFVVAAHAVLAFLGAFGSLAPAVDAGLAVPAGLNRRPLEAGVGVVLAAGADPVVLTVGGALGALVGAGLAGADAAGAGLAFAAGRDLAPFQAVVAVVLAALTVSGAFAAALARLGALVSTAPRAGPVDAGLVLGAGRISAPLEAVVFVHEVDAHHQAVAQRLGAGDGSESGALVAARQGPARAFNADLALGAGPPAGPAVAGAAGQVGAGLSAPREPGADLAGAAGGEGDGEPGEDRPRSVETS